MRIRRGQQASGPHLGPALLRPVMYMYILSFTGCTRKNSPPRHILTCTYYILHTYIHTYVSRTPVDGMARRVTASELGGGYSAVQGLC